MTDQKKLLRAIDYTKKLANGIDPISGESVPDDSILNHIKLARYFFYVHNVLLHYAKEDMEGDKTANRHNKGNSKKPLILLRERLSLFAFSDTPISVSEITKRLNDLIDLENSRRFSHRWITSWLIEAGLLFDSDNKKTPSPAGIGLGILQEQRRGTHGTYHVTLYDHAAQQFLIDNIDAILAMQGHALID